MWPQGYSEWVAKLKSRSRKATRRTHHEFRSSRNLGRVHIIRWVTADFKDRLCGKVLWEFIRDACFHVCKSSLDIVKWLIHRGGFNQLHASQRCHQNQQLSVLSHTFITLTQWSVHCLTVTPGKRYSIVFTMNDQPWLFSLLLPVLVEHYCHPWWTLGPASLNIKGWDP